MTVPALSLVVAVYRRPDFLTLVFESLLRQSEPDFEVLIADDGSGPEIAACVLEWQGRFRRPIRHVWQEDDGFRKTMIVNRAVAESTAEYLVFIDGDCVLHHRFLERHRRRAHPRQALSGRRVMLDEAFTRRVTAEDVRSGAIESPRSWWRHTFPNDRRNGFYLPALYGIRGGGTSRYEILGCNFSLTRADFLAVNGYDERILARGVEDDNLRVRLLNAGMSVRCISQEALQYHLFHTSTGFGHDPASVERWRGTTETWTPYGVAKGPAAPASPAATAPAPPAGPPVA